MSVPIVAREDLVCVVCGASLAGRQRKFCSKGCQNRDRLLKHHEDQQDSEYRERKAAYLREYRKDNPDTRDRREYMRAVNLAKYGITPDDYDAMLENQGGRCAICGQPETALGYHGEIKSLAVDHCHDTGDVRGLLCQSCNMGIGLFDHNDELMQAAIKYLKA